MPNARTHVTGCRVYRGCRYMGLLEETKTEYDAAGIVAQLDALRSKRFSVLHGDMDENVHFTHSRRLFEELAARHPDAITSGEAAIVCLPSERHSALYVLFTVPRMPLPSMRWHVLSAAHIARRNMMRTCCCFFVLCCAAACATW
ncbi:hypothetical protein EON66_05670 [archaeon]|nr:MAG: hypothetical protein EON66_05670 [archaeon]